jgi:hypothetical protein
VGSGPDEGDAVGALTARHGTSEFDSLVQAFRHTSASFMLEVRLRKVHFIRHWVPEQRTGAI